MASFWDMLTGSAASEASNAAAQDTYGKQYQAIQDLLNYGNTYADKFEGLAQSFAPYAQTGTTANNMVQRLLQDPSSVRSLPGYQFALDEGTRALENSASARSGVQSGATMKALQTYGQNYGDTKYADWLSRLMGLSQQGLGATGSMVNTTGQGLQGQLGTRTTGFGGQMQSAGTIGQGMVAGADAEAKGTQNLLNFGGNLLGKFIGANPLSALGGGGTSSFGGGNYGLNQLGIGPKASGPGSGFLIGGV